MDPPSTLALEYTPVSTKKPISELHFNALNSNLQRNNRYIKSPSDESKQLLPSSNRRFIIVPAQNGSSSGGSNSNSSKATSPVTSDGNSPSTSLAVSPVTSPGGNNQQLQPKYAMSLRSLRSGEFIIYFIDYIDITI